jgi:hypothetical protein
MNTCILTEWLSQHLLDLISSVTIFRKTLLVERALHISATRGVASSKSSPLSVLHVLLYWEFTLVHFESACILVGKSCTRRSLLP